jgi:hypothetical protein
MIILLVLVIVALIMWIICESLHVFEEGAPAKDSDILEMLEKYQADFDLDKKYNDKFKLKASYRSNAPSIHQTQYSIIFPYYISGVGVVPIWYKSASKIKQMFDEKISTSKYTVTKRDKLGLNKN